MPNVKPVKPEDASPEVMALYDDLKKKMGTVIQIFQNMGNSAPVLEGFLGLMEAAEKTSLEPRLKEQIALTVSQVNDCQYCLSAHTQEGKAAGLTEPEILAARQAKSDEEKEQAILHFAKKVVVQRADAPLEARGRHHRGGHHRSHHHNHSHFSVGIGAGVYPSHPETVIIERHPRHHYYEEVYVEPAPVRVYPSINFQWLFH